MNCKMSIEIRKQNAESKNRNRKGNGMVVFPQNLIMLEFSVIKSILVTHIFNWIHVAVSISRNFSQFRKLLLHENVYDVYSLDMM